jgi:hypothetical protein
VAKDTNRWAVIALAENAAFALFDIARPPRRIQMGERRQPALDVGSGAYFFGASEQDAYAAGVHGIEEQLLFGIVVGVVNEGNFGVRDTAPDELLADFVVDVPALWIGSREIAEEELGCRAPRLFLSRL